MVGEAEEQLRPGGKENGVTQYQIEIAQNQVPSLVNAGLSLFAYSVDASNRENYTVNFADYSATVIHNYESTTGETLPEEFKDGYSTAMTTLGMRPTATCWTRWRRSTPPTGRISTTTS